MGSLENSALLAPASDTAAVIEPNAQGQFLQDLGRRRDVAIGVPVRQRELLVELGRVYRQQHRFGAAHREQSSGRLALPERAVA